MDLGMSFWLKGLAGLAVGAAVICNLPTRLWMSAEKATLQYLASTVLETLDGTSKKFPASDLWKNNGVVIMAVRRPG